MEHIDPHLNMHSAGGAEETDPSVPSAVEHLIAGSQGVITKRIDLALLEAREIFAHTVRHTILLSAAILLAIASWFAAITSIIWFILPDSAPGARFAVFALVNGSVAVLLGLAARQAHLTPHMSTGITVHAEGDQH